MNLAFIRSNRLSELEQFLDQVVVRLISFDKKLVPLPKAEGKFSWIPRCNRLFIEITNGSRYTIEDLLLTVYRTNSKIGKDNLETVPIKTYGLLPGATGKYEIIVFDPFNEKFEGIKVRIATKEDWEQRELGEKWLIRAEDLSKRKN